MLDLNLKVLYTHKMAGAWEDDEPLDFGEPHFQTYHHNPTTRNGYQRTHKTGHVWSMTGQ